MLWSLSLSKGGKNYLTLLRNAHVGAYCNTPLHVRFGGVGIGDCVPFDKLRDQHFQ